MTEWASSVSSLRSSQAISALCPVRNERGRPSARAIPGIRSRISSVAVRRVRTAAPVVGLVREDPVHTAPRIGLVDSIARDEQLLFLLDGQVVPDHEAVRVVGPDGRSS